MGAVMNRHQEAWPVNVEAIAHDLGIRVYRDPYLPDTISGKIEKNEAIGGPSGYAITINARHSQGRQRFTLAHELAHFALHRHLMGDGVVDDAMYRSPLGGPHERMANRHAAEILLPAPLVRQAYRQTRSYVVLAEMFGVSADAMKIRLKELGLGA